MLVQDRKTGCWYDPKEKWEELLRQEWFIKQMQRMKDEAWSEGWKTGYQDRDDERAVDE